MNIVTVVHPSVHCVTYDGKHTLCGYPVIPSLADCVAMAENAYKPRPCTTCEDTPTTSN